MKEKTLLVDLNPLLPVKKSTPPLDAQAPNESLRFWFNVTNSIVSKQYSLATTYKQEIEEKQRTRAKEREEKKDTWQPVFFTGAVTPVGQPELTPKGREVLDGLGKGVWKIDGIEGGMIGAM
jgi:oxysterol-binding protein-related protein 9/10/11